MPILRNCYLKVIILLCFYVVPTTAIRTDHIGSVPDGREIEAIILAYNYIFMAHANCDPVWSWFIDLKAHLLDTRPWFKARFHDSKLIAWTIRALDNQILDDFDVRVFSIGIKFIADIFPKIKILAQVHGNLIISGEVCKNFL